MDGRSPNAPAGEEDEDGVEYEPDSCSEYDMGVGTWTGVDAMD